MIPWDKTVEFFHSGPDLQVARVHLTLRDALAHFMELPTAEQELCGIAIHEALLKEIDGRAAALGFLRPHAIRALAVKAGYPRPFSWEMLADLIEIYPGQNYARTAERMTMREAVRSFFAMSEERQRCAGINPLEPFSEDGAKIATISYQAIPALARRYGY